MSRNIDHVKNFYLVSTFSVTMGISLAVAQVENQLPEREAFIQKLTEEADRDALYEKCMDEVRSLEDDKLVKLALSPEASRNERIGAALVMLRERPSPEVAEALVPAMYLNVYPGIFGWEKFSDVWQTFPIAAEFRKYPELASQIIDFFANRPATTQIYSSLLLRMPERIQLTSLNPNSRENCPMSRRSGCGICWGP